MVIILSKRSLVWYVHTCINMLYCVDSTEVMTLGHLWSGCWHTGNTIRQNPNEKLRKFMVRQKFRIWHNFIVLHAFQYNMMWWWNMQIGKGCLIYNERMLPPILNSSSRAFLVGYWPHSASRSTPYYHTWWVLEEQVELKSPVSNGKMWFDVYKNHLMFVGWKVLNHIALIYTSRFQHVWILKHWRMGKVVSKILFSIKTKLSPPTQKITSFHPSPNIIKNTILPP